MLTLSTRVGTAHIYLYGSSAQMKHLDLNRKISVWITLFCNKNTLVNRLQHTILKYIRACIRIKTVTWFYCHNVMFICFPLMYMCSMEPNQNLQMQLEFPWWCWCCLFSNWFCRYYFFNIIDRFNVLVADMQTFSKLLLPAVEMQTPLKTHSHSFAYFNSATQRLNGFAFWNSSFHFHLVFGCREVNSVFHVFVLPDRSYNYSLNLAAFE